MSYAKKVVKNQERLTHCFLRDEPDVDKDTKVRVYQRHPEIQFATCNRCQGNVIRKVKGDWKHWRV